MQLMLVLTEEDVEPLQDLRQSILCQQITSFQKMLICQERKRTFG